MFFLFTASAWGLDCTIRGHEELSAEILNEMQDLSCKKNQVHLTFDDGPSVAITPTILKELKTRNVKATFFITTTNLSSQHPKALLHKKIVQDEMFDGHLIASHGHDHSAHALRMNAQGVVLEKGFTQKEREYQIKESMDLLNSATSGKFSKQDQLLFRFPYGRGAMPSPAELNEMENNGEMTFSASGYASRLKEYQARSPSLQTIAGSGFSHLGWNHDSHDSSLSAKMQDRSVLKKFILSNLKSLCHGPSLQVALYHDIKEINQIAIPAIIDLGQCLGLRFISADEMKKKKSSLEKDGVYISREFIQKAPVDKISSILEKLSLGMKIDCVEEEVDQSCYSQQYGKRYTHCAGSESICFEGKWYSRTDPIVQGCIK